MPESLPPRAPIEPRRSRFTLYLAFIICMMGAGFLLMIPTGFIGPVIVFGGCSFFGVIALHYLVWGRWLDRLIKEEQAEEVD